jgi:bcr-type benzoyl-CoA reductase subunit C
MASVLDRLTPIIQDPYSPAREAKAQGRPVVAVSPMHFPEELIHASGALPVVLQESNEPVTEGFGHIYPFYCGFSRSNVDWAVKGRLGLFDAVVISDVCLQLRHMGHIMRRNMPKTPFLYIQWPLEASIGRWLSFSVQQLSRMRSRLEQIVGRPITDDALHQSIALYNRHRSLLQRVYELRQQKLGVLRAKDMVNLVLAGMVMPKEEHIGLLEELIPELEKREPSGDGRVKLFASGHLCQAVKTDILDMMEDLGGVVVGDDLYTGYRYFATAVPTGVPPMEAMARHYLEMALPCPTRYDPNQEWGHYVAQAVPKAGAKGLVTMVVKFCEPHMIYYPFLRDVLNGAGVPHLMIETEHEVVSLEGTRTRLQAFIEMLSA